MKKMTLLVALLATFGTIDAQSNYSKAIGLRLSPASSYDMVAVSFKTFVTEAGAFELNAGFGTNRYPGTAAINKFSTTSASISAAYQHHFPIKPVDGLKWYVGGGASLVNTFYDNADYRGVSAGLFPTGGVDYKFKNIPLNVSADYRPTFIIAKPKQGWGNFLGENFGVAARYTF